MAKLIYVVKVRELIPQSIPRKVIEAHLKALTSAQRQNKSKDEFRYQLATSTGTAANEN